MLRLLKSRNFCRHFIKRLIHLFMAWLKSELSTLIKCEMWKFIQDFEESINTGNHGFMENEDFLEVTTRIRESVQKIETLQRNNGRC
jgi:hypothetical protein